MPQGVAADAGGREGGHINCDASSWPCKGPPYVHPSTIESALHVMCAEYPCCGLTVLPNQRKHTCGYHAVARECGQRNTISEDANGLRNMED